MSALLNAASLTANPVRNGYRSQVTQKLSSRRVSPRSNDRIRGKLNAFFSHEPFPTVISVFSRRLLFAHLFLFSVFKHVCHPL